MRSNCLNIAELPVPIFGSLRAPLLPWHVSAVQDNDHCREKFSGKNSGCGKRNSKPLRRLTPHQEALDRIAQGWQISNIAKAWTALCEVPTAAQNRLPNF